METTKIFFFISVWFCTCVGSAQVSIGEKPSSSRALAVASQNVNGAFGGFLMPVVTEAQQALISVSAIDHRDDGMMVYVSDPITGKRCWDIYDSFAQVWRSIYCPSECNTILFSEDFKSYAENTGVTGISSINGDYPLGVSKWSLTSFSSFGSSTPALPGMLVDINDYALVQGGELVLRDTNGAFRLETQTIDITGFTNIAVSIDFREAGSLEYDLSLHGNDFSCGNTQSDYIDVEISTNGGATFTEVPNFSSYGNGNHTVADDFTGTVGFLMSGITGTSLVIRIRTQNWSDDEYFYIDNIVVSCN